MSTVHLHPTAPLAPRVLLPGDPGRALLLAQDLLEAPKMFNHHRGLWGYSGAAKADGEPLTIQATGMGGPSAAIVVHELCELGAHTLVRVGTCGALDPALRLGELLIVEAAVGFDGVSVALEGSGLPSADVLAALRAGSPDAAGAPVASVDLFYDDRDERARWAAAGAHAVEMEAAAVFAVAARTGARAGCVLVVTDLLDAGDGRERMDAAALEAAGLAVGRSGLRGLIALD